MIMAGLLQICGIATISWQLYFICVMTGNVCFVICVLLAKYQTLKWYNFIDPLNQTHYYRFILTLENRTLFSDWHTQSDENSKWCYENARGRWRVAGSVVLFARKTDAAMFTLYSGVSAELPFIPGRKNK